MKYDPPNEADFGNPKALFSVVFSGEVHQHVYGLDKNGSIANPWIEEPFDSATGIVKDPDRYAGRVVGSDRVSKGFQNLASAFRPLFDLASGLKEGEFKFASVFYNTVISAMSVEGVLPIYEPSCGIDPSRVTGDGLCNGQTQKQVGMFAVGINLGLLSKFLSEMYLKGGYMFYVERQTGHIIGASNKNIKVHDENNKAITADQVDDQMVLDLTQWVLKEREDKEVTWAGVKSGKGEATISGKDYFMFIVDYQEFGVQWVGVLAIPWDSVMEDIERQKWATLILGMFVAVAVKFFLQFLRNLTQAFLWKSVVYPAIDKAAAEDVGNAVRSAVQEAQGQQQGGQATRAPAVAAAAGIAAAAGAGTAVAVSSVV